MINKVIKILKKNGTILYPTDTVWGLGCDATNSVAVNKIYTIKKRNKFKSLIVLVDSVDMLKNYIEQVPLSVIIFLKTTKKPTTVIYNNPKNLAKNVMAADNTIAIRIVKSGFTHELISKFKKPIISTSANISNKLTPQSFELIDKHIINKVDFIVTLPNYKSLNKPSVIIKEVDNKIEFIRK